MAQGILAKSRSKLNLSRRQTELFQKIILVGSQMADVLKNFDQEPIIPEIASELVERWGGLMIELVRLLL